MKEIIAKMYLIPVLFYGLEVFSDISSVGQRKKQVAFNNVARYIYNRQRADHISDVTIYIFNMPLKFCKNLRTLLILHKIISKQEPSYLYEKLIFSARRRTRNIISFKYKYLCTRRQFLVLLFALGTNFHTLSRQSVPFSSKKKVSLVNHLVNPVGHVLLHKRRTSDIPYRQLYGMSAF